MAVASFHTPPLIRNVEHVRLIEHSPCIRRFVVTHAHAMLCSRYHTQSAPSWNSCVSSWRHALAGSTSRVTHTAQTWSFSHDLEPVHLLHKLQDGYISQLFEMDLPREQETITVNKRPNVGFVCVYRCKCVVWIIQFYYFVPSQSYKVNYRHNTV
jgi:hypothetical protein